MKASVGDCGLRIAESGLPRRRLPAAVAACCAFLLLFAVAAPAQDDIVKVVEAKRLQLKQKEEALKREDERLQALRKDVDERIAAYTKLLDEVRTALKKLETVKGEKIGNVVKAYEVMPAEEAAARLSALDEDAALEIMSRMKSRKAGAVIGAMEPHKAASLTKNLLSLAGAPSRH